jgi:hypothetical protein
VENVLVVVASKDAFAKKLIVKIRLVQITASVLKEHAFVKRDGPDKIVHKKIKLLFHVFQPAQTTASLIHTVKSAFVNQSSAVMTVRWNSVT